MPHLRHKFLIAHFTTDFLNRLYWQFTDNRSLSITFWKQLAYSKKTRHIAGGL